MSTDTRLEEAEQWRSIDGAAGYEVSSLGRVRSWVAQNVPLPLIKATWHNPHAGYVWAELVHDTGEKKQVAVHRLVAAAFLGPRPDGLVTRHLDGDDQNNQVTNLRYGTPRQNNLDVIDHGRHNFASRDACKNGHPFTPENTAPRGDCNGRVCKQCNRDRSLAYYHRKQRERMGADT